MLFAIRPFYVKFQVDLIIKNTTIALLRYTYKKAAPLANGARKKMKQLLTIFICLLFCSRLVGQADTSFSNIRNLQISNFQAQKGDTIAIDTATILPYSVILKDQNSNKTLDLTYYNVENNAIIFLKKYNTPSLSIQYRVLPFNLSEVSAYKDTAWISPRIDGRLIGGYQYNPNSAANNPFSKNGLNYSGTYSRGIAFGNNQDATFNSNFNLQMSGDLGDGIEVVAAISDNNIPIQPQGNTQQLQDFDKIFIQIKKDKTSLTAGDYELRRPKSYFMNYYKKLQGATFENTLNLGENKSLYSKGSFAIARGKFARNTITALEGNQGPYRLRGNSGERFIIILAGTERVFIDGQLMTRGQNKDYVIDYNRGEVTFTPNQLITKDKRIIVEFEYNDQNYNRTLYAISNSYQHSKKLSFDFNLYSEQDGRTTTSDRELTTAQQDALRNVGDDSGVALASGLDSVAFSPDIILYRLADTLVNGVAYDSVLVYSTHPDSAQYIARFSEVGQGKGNYIRLQSAANGTVFGWVAPDAITGLPQGSFEPIIQLTAPAQRQMYTLGANYQINKKSFIQSEIALSHRDLNRFSDFNTQDNTGYAAKIAYQNEQTLSVKRKIKLIANADYEFTNRNFNPLNPFRPREFTRDWNIENAVGNNQHIAKAGFILSQANLGSLEYEFSTYLQGQTYSGFKHFGTFKMNKKGFNVLAQGNLLSTAGLAENTTFFRPKVRIEKTFSFQDTVKTNAPTSTLKLGVYGERERNQRFSANADTLAATSFYYDLVQAYSDFSFSKNANIRANYQRRYDYLPASAEFTTLTVADDINISGSYRFKSYQRLNFNLTYRTLQIEQPEVTTLEPQETYLGRVDYNLTLPKGWLRYNANYQIGSGQEQKVQYNYLLVDVGQGVYTWIDRNNDGVKQLDEFEVSIFQDQADHIRVITFTDEYIRTNQVQFNQSFNLVPRALWRKPKGFQKLLTRFSVQSNWQILRKVRQVEGISPWNPFQLEIADTALVSVTSNIRNSLFFNQISPKFRAEIGMLANQSRIVLTTGYEDRRRNEQFSKLLWNITKQVTTKLEGTIGTSANDSEVFNTRDYNIEFYRLQPEAVFQYQTIFRANFKYKYQNSKNTLIDAPETAIFHDLSTELTYRQKSRAAVALNFSFAQVNFSGAANTPLEFAMLQGLKNGQNFLWNLTYRRTLMKNLEINLTYEGRKTGDLRVVHTGRGGVRAVF